MKGLLTKGILYISFIGLACKQDTIAQSSEGEVPADTEQHASTALILSADADENTYSRINKVFAVGTGDVVEVPDCSHEQYGEHIKQVYDDVLKADVFVFVLHKSPDNDRCTAATDRQRNEIKTYDRSPESTKAKLNETVVYKWKFKIDKDFQPSPSFSHLHQIKPADGDASMPIITFTARYRSSGDQLEIMYRGRTEEDTPQKTLASVPLSEFKGQWVAVEETLKYAAEGTYKVEIKHVSDGTTIVSYTNDNIDLWRTGTSFCRPKWGLYRSLNNPTYLRDEEVRFNDFSIQVVK